jgi:hypothetical protein
MEVAYTPPNQYGQKYPTQSSELIQTKIKQLKDELKTIPEKYKKNVLGGLEKIPGIGHQQER